MQNILTKEQQNNDYIYFVKKPFVAHIKKKTYDRSLKKYKIIIKKLTIPKYF